jgi:hypothetical protein
MAGNAAITTVRPHIVLGTVLWLTPSSAPSTYPNADRRGVAKSIAGGRLGFRKSIYREYILGLEYTGGDGYRDGR